MLAIYLRPRPSILELFEQIKTEPFTLTARGDFTEETSMTLGARIRAVVQHYWEECPELWVYYDRCDCSVFVTDRSGTKSLWDLAVEADAKALIEHLAPVAWEELAC